jgi:endoplasmic reticulum resident protein 44
MEYLKVSIYLALAVQFLHVSYINSAALQLTQQTYHETLQNNKVVLINFYADWCMFSQQLAPIFHQTADILHEEYTNVKIARVDCEVETQIALENAVSKYPTIKLFRNGKALKKEFRGQRSVDAFSAFIKQQMKPAVGDVLDPVDLKINEERNTVVGYFDAKNNDAYKTFEIIADEMFESVDFLACLGEGFNEKRPNGGEHVVYKPKKISGEQEAAYTGSLIDNAALHQWLNDKANPLVREITFENGEELTEEGLPFLILFHKPDDVTSIQRFKNAVIRELLSERGNINFLTADGTTFSHPLHHLGKSIDDLPIISIDSFSICIYSKMLTMSMFLEN